MNRIQWNEMKWMRPFSQKKITSMENAIFKTKFE